MNLSILHFTYVRKLVDSAMQRTAQSKTACNARSAKPFLDLALFLAIISALEWWDVLSDRLQGGPREARCLKIGFTLELIAPP